MAIARIDKYFDKNSGQQRLTTGGSATVCQLTSMHHPMHRSHQKDMSPRPEECLEARRAASTRLIEIVLSQCLKQGYYGLMLQLQGGEQVAIRLIVVSVRSGSGLPSEAGLQAFKQILAPLHNLLKSPFREKQVANNPVRMIPSRRWRDKGSRSQVFHERHCQSVGVLICRQQQLFRLHVNFPLVKHDSGASETEQLHRPHGLFCSAVKWPAAVEKRMT